MASLTSRSRTNGNNKFFDAELDRIERRSRMEYQQLVEAEVRERLADAERPRLDELPVVNAIVSNLRRRIALANSRGCASPESIEHMKAILAMAIREAATAFPSMSFGDADIASGASPKALKRVARFDLEVREERITQPRVASPARVENTKKPRKASQ